LEWKEGKSIGHSRHLPLALVTLTYISSTVSKVLSREEEYLKSPPKPTRDPTRRRGDRRIPNIERALLNWARKHQEKGLLLDDETITDKALHFAQICECPEVAKKFTTQEWLDMFKGKLFGAETPHKDQPIQ
jgi:hypothetical protein